MSPLVVDQITFQLQTRIVEEIQRLTYRSRSGQESAPDIGLQPLSRKDLESLRSGLPLPQIGGRSVCAVLDLDTSTISEKVTAEKTSTKIDTTPLPSYRDLPLLYPPSAFSRTNAAPIAVFKIEQLFPRHMHEMMKLPLQTYLAPACSTEPVGSVALLCQSEGSESEDRFLEVGEAKHHQGVTQFFIALWRLRLWFGYGWTVPCGADSALDGAEEEQLRGCTLQGFKSVQGVFHAKWP